MGAAGTGRASVEASAIHDLNPAMLVHLQGRDFHSALLSDGWTIGMTDNSFDNIVPAALGYRVSKTTPDHQDELIAKDLRLTLCGFLGSSVSVGVTGKQQTWEQGPFNWQQVNADVGLGWIATPKLGVGVVISDVYGERDELPVSLRTPMRTAVGLNYLYQESIRLRADVVSAARNDFKRPELLLGYESSLTQYFLVRFGYGIDHERDREFGAAGLGFDLPRFHVNYGFQARAKGDVEDRHSIDLGIPF